MTFSEIYAAEQTMHTRTEERLHRAVKDNWLRRLRQTRPGLLYRLGRQLEYLLPVRDTPDAHVPGVSPNGILSQLSVKGRLSPDRLQRPLLKHTQVELGHGCNSLAA